MSDAVRKIVQVPSRPPGEREWIFDQFRRWGYLSANLDPLGFFSPPFRAELDISGDVAAQARGVYSGTVGVEFMHISDPERREWIARRMEAPPSATPNQDRILERLMRAELFEQTLQARFVGTKRYSLEGIA